MSRTKKKARAVASVGRYESVASEAIEQVGQARQEFPERESACVAFSAVLATRKSEKEVRKHNSFCSALESGKPRSIRVLLG